MRDISRLFLEVIRDHLEVAVIVSPDAGPDGYLWSVEFLDSNRMEDTYVSWLLPRHSANTSNQQSSREAHLRQRFRDYMQQFVLFTKKQHVLQLVAKRDGNLVNVQDVSLSH